MPSLEVVDLGDNLLERPPPLKFTKNLQLFNVQGNKFNKGIKGATAFDIFLCSIFMAKSNSLVTDSGFLQYQFERR